MTASEFDQLVSQDGILMAGRFGPDWTVIDHRCKGLFVESPAALQMASTFCSSITMVFNALAFAADSITASPAPASTRPAGCLSKAGPSPAATTPLPCLATGSSSVKERRSAASTNSTRCCKEGSLLVQHSDGSRGPGMIRGPWRPDSGHLACCGRLRPAKRPPAPGPPALNAHSPPSDGEGEAWAHDERSRPSRSRSGGTERGPSTGGSRRL